ncbi:Hypothetical protein R9X50_00632000 [Acrodontium crateriforme]|uniref:carnosine N-methyltransferase n=1 Tax=Acrodontium crateriforme TaxID=150365 RepID=A0AAQ3M9H0_9PEZI|nr:Hypothetical protein R9X50_00632000 [Acrodontium crateriforme]
MTERREFTASVDVDRQTGPVSHPFDDPEETRVLYAAFDSFRGTEDAHLSNFRSSQYRHAAHYNVTHLRRQSFYSLPSDQIDLLSEPPFSLPRTFDAVDDAIDSNADLSEAILEVGLASFGQAGSEASKGFATPSDLDKARSTIRQFYRDWSAEGAGERQAVFEPIFSALKTHLPETTSQSLHEYDILVPGAGLGRLVFDLCCAGYTVEGNEISYHQLLASNYILNCTHKAEQYTIYPWALNFSNHLTRTNQLQSYNIPDIHPGTALESATQQSEVHYSQRMSMTAGDFCVLYQKLEYDGCFAAVTTCFFIDTAPNIISYIQTIKHCLKPGGLWINAGPLLWHFESSPTPAERDRHKPSASTNEQSNDHSGSQPTKQSSVGIAEPGSFELTDSEVISLVSSLGFEVLEHTHVPAGVAGYIQDPESMLQNMYRPSFWVARKK